MYSAIKILRRGGCRLPDREIAAMKPIVGQLRLSKVGGVPQLAIYAPGDNSYSTPLVPILYDARVATMHGDGQLWEGEERADDPGRTTVKQEWSVRLGVQAEASDQMKRWGSR